MTSALERVADVIRRETGIWIKEPQMAGLEAALARLRPPMDAGRFLRAHADADASSELVQHLIDEVSIKETFFFRQRDDLDAIDWRMLLARARLSGSEEVRVWVAACATGEEAYTLAMLACEAFGTSDPPVSVTATDISPAALARAREGRYRGRRTSHLGDRMAARYFGPTRDGVAVGGDLQRLVRFQRQNLVSDPAPGGPFELIACRNVLIYFDLETVERVIGSLESALAPDGMLVLGAADRLCGSARLLSRPHASETPQPRVAPAAAPRRALRRPLGREHARQPPGPTGLAAALQAADEDKLDEAVAITEALLREDPLDADAYLVRGMAELGGGDPGAAVHSLRRALYVDPSFGLAAFTLARAHDRRGDSGAATRAYQQALQTLDSSDTRHEEILDHVDLGDVAAACAMRLTALREDPR